MPELTAPGQHSNCSCYCQALILLSAVLIVVFPCAPILPHNQLSSPDVRRERPAASNIFKENVTYSLVDGNWRAELGFRSTDLHLRFEMSQNGKVEASAELPVARKMEFLRPLLERFFEEQGYQPRYGFSMNFYTEMGTRLADAAVQSKDWDTRTGRTYNRGIDFILQFLTHSVSAYSELASVVGSFHYRIRVESIENRIVLPVREFSRYEKTLLTTNPKPGDQLPCGASVFFTLEQETKT